MSVDLLRTPRNFRWSGNLVALNSGETRPRRLNELADRGRWTVFPLWA